MYERASQRGNESNFSRQRRASDEKGQQPRQSMVRYKCSEGIFRRTRPSESTLLNLIQYMPREHHGSASFPYKNIDNFAKANLDVGVIVVGEHKVVGCIVIVRYSCIFMI